MSRLKFLGFLANRNWYLSFLISRVYVRFSLTPLTLAIRLLKDLYFFADLEGENTVMINIGFEYKVNMVPEK